MPSLNVVCDSRRHCNDCRGADAAGDKFRRDLTRHYTPPAGGIDCPHGMAPVMASLYDEGPSGIVPVRLMIRGLPAEEPPTPTAGQVASFALALVTGRYVPDDVRSERAATCAGCDQARYSLAQRTPWCGVCGCGTGGLLSRKITDLTAYAENLPAWGCKHPDRGAGAGWKR